MRISAVTTMILALLFAPMYCGCIGLKSRKASVTVVQSGDFGQNQTCTCPVCSSNRIGLIDRIRNKLNFGATENSLSDGSINSSEISVSQTERTSVIESNEDDIEIGNLGESELPVSSQQQIAISDAETNSGAISNPTEPTDEIDESNGMSSVLGSPNLIQTSSDLQRETNETNGQDSILTRDLSTQPDNLEGFYEYEADTPTDRTLNQSASVQSNLPTPDGKPAQIREITDREDSASSTVEDVREYIDIVLSGDPIFNQLLEYNDAEAPGSVEAGGPAFDELPEPASTAPPAEPIPSTSIERPSQDHNSRPKPIVLRARPTRNHILKSSHYGPLKTSENQQLAQPAFRHHQPASTSVVPARRANSGPNPKPSLKSLDPDKLSVEQIEFRSLPNIELPELTNIAQTNQQKYEHLRVESDAEKEKQRLLDIQAVVKYEIDRRIQAGELLVPGALSQPHEPTTEFQTVAIPVPILVAETQQTPAINEPRSRLQMVTPKSDEVALTPESRSPQSNWIAPSERSQIYLPDRKPGVPVHSFELEESSIQAPESSSVDSPYFSESNLFVPVLELTEPTLIDAQNAFRDQIETLPVAPDFSLSESPETKPEIGTIELRIDSVPIHRPIIRESEFNSFRTLNQMPTMGTRSNAQIDESAEILRLRAYSKPDRESAPTTARIRNVSTQYHYLPNSPQPNAGQSEREPKRVDPNIEIPRIRAEPVYNYDRRQQTVHGLSELEPNETKAKIRIIDR